MENSKGHDNKSIQHKVLPHKNLSESALFYKRLSINEMNSDNDFRIVGIKVQLDGDQVYSFTFDKERSKSVDALPILADSSELEISSTCLENKDCEIRIQSKNDSSTSINEQLCLIEDYYEEKSVDIIEINPGRDGFHCIRYVKASPPPPPSLKYRTEKASREAETEKESTSAGVQRTDLELFSCHKLEDTCNQEEIIESAESKTKENFKNQTAVYVDRSMTPEMEPATILSIENDSDSSTPFQYTEKAAKNSINIENLLLNPLMETQSEKVIGEEHRIEENCQCSCGHKKQHDCIYNCCYHRNCGDIIPTSILFGQNLLYLASIHNALKCDYCQCRLNRSCSETTNNCTEKLKSGIHARYCCECGKNAKSVEDTSASMTTVEKSERPEGNLFKPKKLNSLSSKENILPQSQVKSFENAEQIKEKGDYIVMEVFESHRPETKIENSKSIDFKPENFTSLATTENISPELQIESFEQIEKADKHNFEQKVFRPSEIEIIPLLDTLDIFEHCLSSCSLPQQDQPLFEIKIIDKKSSVKILYENLAEEEVKSNVETTANQIENEVKEEPGQKIVGGSKKKCLRNDSNLDLCYSYSEVCPLKICHKKSESIQKIENGAHKNTSSVFQIENNESFEIQSRTTSPNFSEGLDDECKIVNDHLLSLRPVEEYEVQKATQILHKRWFHVIRSKCLDVVEVRNFIQYFKDFSNNLVKTVLHLIDNNGNNVLHFTFTNNRFDLVDELLKSGYALDLLNKGNKFGNTPLMICAVSHPNSTSDWTVVRKCFEFSDVNEKSTKNGQTPLMIAASSGFQKMVDLLLDVGANPNLQDKDESTALMYAAEHGYKMCVKSLMQHNKCDPTIKDKDGETACSIALNNGHKNITVLIHMQALQKRRLSQNSYSKKHSSLPIISRQPREKL